jgi:hypothetical protein
MKLIHTPAKMILILNHRRKSTEPVNESNGYTYSDENLDSKPTNEASKKPENNDDVYSLF